MIEYFLSCLFFIFDLSLVFIVVLYEFDVVILIKVIIFFGLNFRIFIVLFLIILIILRMVVFKVVVKEIYWVFLLLEKFLDYGV